jgi:hypothetical protein
MEENTVLEKKKLPAFLKILCILSFVGIGVYLVTYIFGYIYVKTLIEDSRLLNEAFGEGSDVSITLKDSEPLMKNGILYNILSMVGCIICLVGVIMMWKLKKVGFYIYIVGEIAPMALPFILLGGFGALSGFSLVLGIIPIIFIALYALNLKHLE